MPATSDLEMLVEAAARSNPRRTNDVCDQLLALAEAASQHSSEHTLPILRVATHHSSKDEPGSTGRYAGSTPSLGHHSTSGSPAGVSPPQRANKRGRPTRGAARSTAPITDDGSHRKYRKYASNVPRMGRIPWIDNRHTDKKLRSKYAGVTQYQQTALWKARISCALQKQIHLGVYADEEEAARCYDRAAYHFKGDRAVLNHLHYDYSQDPFILEHQHLEDKDFIAQLRARATDLLRMASMGLPASDENTGMPPMPMLNPPKPLPLEPEFDPSSLFVGLPGTVEFDPANPFGSAVVKQQRSRHTPRSGPLRPALPPKPSKAWAGMPPVDRAKAWGNVLMSVATAYVSTAAAIVPIVLAG